MLILGLYDEDGKSFCWSSEVRGERETLDAQSFPLAFGTPCFRLSVYAVMTDCY